MNMTSIRKAYVKTVFPLYTPFIHVYTEVYYEKITLLTRKYIKNVFIIKKISTTL